MRIVAAVSIPPESLGDGDIVRIDGKPEKYLVADVLWQGSKVKTIVVVGNDGEPQELSAVLHRFHRVASDTLTPKADKARIRGRLSRKFPQKKKSR